MLPEFNYYLLFDSTGDLFFFGTVIKSEAAANKGKTQLLIKSDVGERPHVTFPVHLQVAKMLENGLTFGSFDSNFVKEVSSDNRTSGCDESSHGTAAYGATARLVLMDTLSKSYRVTCYILMNCFNSLR